MIKDIARERQLVEQAPAFKTPFRMSDVVANILYDVMVGEFQLQTTRGKRVYSDFLNYLVQRFLKSNTGLIHRSYWNEHREVLKTEDFVQSLTVCVLDYFKKLLNTKTGHIEQKSEKLIFVIGTIQKQRWYLMTHHRIYLSTGRLLPLTTITGVTYMRNKLKQWGPDTYALFIKHGDDILAGKNREAILREIYDSIGEELKKPTTWDTISRMVYLDNSRSRVHDVREMLAINLQVDTAIFHYGSKRTKQLEDWKL